MQALKETENGKLLWLKAVVAEKNTPMALWTALTANKELATIAMRALLGSELFLAPELERARSTVGKIFSPTTDLAIARHNREERRAARAAQQTEARAIAKRIETKIVIRALFSFTLRDGSKLANRKWSELEHIADASEMESKIIRAILASTRVTDLSARVADIISPDKFDQIVARV